MLWGHSELPIENLKMPLVMHFVMPAPVDSDPATPPVKLPSDPLETHPSARQKPASVSMSELFGLLCFVVLGAEKASPGYAPSELFLRSKIAFGWFADLRRLKALRTGCPDAGVARALRERPAVLGLAVWPYIHSGWNFEQRLGAFEAHFRSIRRIAPRLDLSTQESLVVASLEDIRPGLRLVLDRAAWFSREGELVLNIFLHDKRLFSLACSVGLDAEQYVVRVGAVQGVKDENILALYRDLTKEMHGLRPRDLLLDALRMMCSSIGITKILGIADCNRQHRNVYYGQAKSQNLEGDYDTVWTEQGGVRRDSGFFEISSKIEFRDMEDIPSKKRSMYRRRYEFLTALADQISTNCTRKG